MHRREICGNGHVRGLRRRNVESSWEQPAFLLELCRWQVFSLEQRRIVHLRLHELCELHCGEVRLEGKFRVPPVRERKGEQKMAKKNILKPPLTKKPPFQLRFVSDFRCALWSRRLCCLSCGKARERSKRRLFELWRGKIRRCWFFGVRLLLPWQEIFCLQRVLHGLRNGEVLFGEWLFSLFSLRSWNICSQRGTGEWKLRA